MLASLALDDTPLSYRPSRGPGVPLTFTYSQREAYQPANFSYANVGHKWNYTGISYIVDDPASPGVNTQRYLPGGGTRKQEGYNAGTRTFAPDAGDQSVLVLVKQEPVTYERRRADGGKDIYSHGDGQKAWPRRVFLTQTVDEAGNTLTYSWDKQNRLTQITDATGRKTTLQYTHADPLKITGITDPRGRKAKVEYDASGRLLSITDALGLTSRVGYRGASEFVEQLTTPYGTSRFNFGENGTTRWVELTNAAGETERIESRHTAPGIGYSEPQVPKGLNLHNAYLNSRNTFYWDATANARHHGDYTQAEIQHWYHERTNTNLTAGVLESIKKPLESRVWFTYPGQTILADAQSRLTVRRSYANATSKATETRYLWCGDEICQKRDGKDTIQATYYEEGEQQGNTALYYVKDHLGSVTDIITAQGKRIGELDYSPYGETTRASGQTTDVRYAGMFYLPETGFYLTHYRFYDPNTGRWLNRDPIGERGGLNLYGYVGGNPVNYTDPLGLVVYYDQRLAGPLGELLAGSKTARDFYNELHNAKEIYTIHYNRGKLPETNVDSGQIFMDPEFLKCYEFEGDDGKRHGISARRALGHELAHIVIDRKLGWKAKVFRILTEGGAIGADNKIARELGEPGKRTGHDIYKKNDCQCK
jgi:RHS repeat-associated protein